MGPCGELATCAQTVARAYMPLGTASSYSIRSVDRLGKVSGARKAADGASPVLLRGAGGAVELWYRGGVDMRRVVRLALDESGARGRLDRRGLCADAVGRRR
jgi:hypothetical protein